MNRKHFVNRHFLRSKIYHHFFLIFFITFILSYLLPGVHSSFSKGIKNKGEDFSQINRNTKKAWPSYETDTLSPRESKIKAKEMLLSLKNNEESLTKSRSKKPASTIDYAIFHISKSLKENLWRDAWHLHWAKGALVFNAEGRAAQCLEKIAQHENETLSNVATEALHHLVSADYILAMTALNEALACADTSRYIHMHIAKSEKYLHLGQNAGGDPEKAIEYFRKSWHFACLSLNKLPAVSMGAEPLIIPLEGSTTLSWSSSNSDVVTIDNGIGTVNPSASLVVSPQETTTYTISVTNIAGTAMAAVTITVVPPPTVTMSAEPETIFLGEGATLTWSSTDAGTVFIDNGIGEVAQSGSLIVSPQYTTTYTITVTNIAGTAMDTATISVIRMPTVSISADPLTIILGGRSTLSWSTINADTVHIDNGIGEVGTSGSIEVSPALTTTYTITASNSAGTATDTVTVTVVRPPLVSIGVNPPYIRPGETATLSWSAINADTVHIDNGIGEVGASGSIEVSPAATTTYTITATNPAGSATKTATLKVINPAPLPEGSFGKPYESLIPDDATIDQYDEKRFCVITGFVYALDDAGERIPLPGVTVSIHAHPEYGTAPSNEEGRFVIPADGGGIYTLVYEKEGYIQSQRQVETAWSEVAMVDDDPLLTRKDTKTTQVVFDGNPGTVIVHESTPVSDENGTRSCTLVFTGDNRAYAPDGTELTTITTSVTEYTTPDSMPAILPPSNIFTYCAEFSIVEAENVRFAKPVIAYVDDFLNVGAGGIVPVGFYDRDRAMWFASRNGIAVTLLDTDSDGVVDGLDADGDGDPDDMNMNGTFQDDAIGLENPQRYQPGATFWRVELDHFSPGDLNFMPSDEDFPPPNPPGPPVIDEQRRDDCEDCPGSSVEHRSRVFHEDVLLPGTDIV